MHRRPEWSNVETRLRFEVGRRFLTGGGGRQLTHDFTQLQRFHEALAGGAAAISRPILVGVYRVAPLEPLSIERQFHTGILPRAHAGVDPLHRRTQAGP